MSKTLYGHVRLVATSIVSIAAVLAAVLAFGARADSLGARARAVTPASALVADQAEPSEEPEAGPPPAPLEVGRHASSSGARLANGRGMTLYTFSGDSPGRSSCASACAARWQPARSAGGKPQPGTGVRAAEVGSIQRADGSDQVTFNGHPLYYFTDDEQPGDSNGQGRHMFGGTWSAVPPTAEGSRP